MTIDLSSLQTLHIGNASNSLCFSFLSQLMLRDLPSLEEVELAGSSMNHTKKLVLMSRDESGKWLVDLPKLRSFIASNGSLSELVNASIRGIPQIQAFRVECDPNYHCLVDTDCENLRLAGGLWIERLSDNIDPKKRRAYTGIEPVTSRTLSENHTTRPAGHRGRSWTSSFQGHSVCYACRWIIKCQLEFLSIISFKEEWWR